MTVFSNDGKPIPFKLGNDIFVVGVHKSNIPDRKCNFSITKNDKQIAIIECGIISRGFWDTRLSYTVHYDKNEDLLFIVAMVCRISIRFWDPSNKRETGVGMQLIKKDPYPERGKWLPDDEKLESV